VSFKNNKLIQSVVILVVTTVVSLWLYDVLNLLNIAMFFMIPILFSALHNKKNEVTMVSIISIILFDVLFIPPRFEIMVHDTNYLISFIIMFIIGQIVYKLAKNASLAKELEISKKIEDTLLESLSHELRTPLAAISGCSSSLLNSDLKLSLEDQNELIENIDKNAEDMDKLITNLINSAKLTNGVLNIKREFCDIQDIIGSALIKTEKEKLATYTNISDIPIIGANAILIEQAIINLLDNAFKYGYDVEVIVFTRALGVEIIVSNKGLIPTEHEIINASKPFCRLSNSKSHRGLGLGLHVAKLIAEIHGGQLTLSIDKIKFIANLYLPKNLP